jgi:hypothetical protein
MIKMGFDAKAFQQQLGNLAKVKLAVMPKTYQEFVKNTPVKTGNAKRSTTLVKNEIQANYAYAGVLDAGRGFRDGQMRGSKQAPQGMTIPATKLLQQEVHNYIMKNSKGPR